MPRRLLSLSGAIGALLAVVASVDISPAARQYLVGKAWKDVWVTDVYQTCPKGFDLPVVEEGVPEVLASWDVVQVEAITVYVPKNKRYKGDIPRFVHFSRNEKEWVGVVNQLRGDS